MPSIHITVGFVGNAVLQRLRGGVLVFLPEHEAVRSLRLHAAGLNMHPLQEAFLGRPPQAVLVSDGV